MHGGVRELLSRGGRYWSWDFEGQVYNTTLYLVSKQWQKNKGAKPYLFTEARFLLLHCSAVFVRCTYIPLTANCSKKLPRGGLIFAQMIGTTVKSGTLLAHFRTKSTCRGETTNDGSQAS
jgi:hypothetical protein